MNSALKDEYLVPDLDFKARDLDENGFRLDLATQFDKNGEEKLQFSEIQAIWPVKLPPKTTWVRIPNSDEERYRAGDIEFSFSWVSSSRTSGTCTVVNLVITHPKGFALTEKTAVTKTAFQWPSRTSQEVGGKIRVTWVGNLVLPPWQMSTAAPITKVSSNVQLPVIMIDGPEQDQRFVRSIVNNLSYATQRPHLPVAKHGFAPFGLNNSLYFGHTFWDMDVWVLPSMLFVQPEAVRGMNRYRLDRAAQAGKNSAEFFRKPDSGMMFPWESSVSGKETVRASSVKEHHISGSVLWGLNLSEKAGIAPPTEVGKVAAGVSRFFGVRSVSGADGREIKDVMSPDENHIGDNDLYTNLLAQWAMNGRKWDGPAKFKLPKDETSFLTYNDDKLRSYKQAAAVLSIFPLQYPEAEKQARTMMERFESKVSKNGPAMSDAIHATIWARLGEKEKAYDAWKRAWEPFVKGPQMMFSEKRSSERTYFYTGAAGCLNTVLYGFAGFRFDDKPLEGALWKNQLKSGWWLSCKPCLPPKWKSLKINPMVVDGQRFSVEITSENVSIQPSVGS